MKKIPLTQGKFTMVDDEDFERVSEHKWCASKRYGKKYYAVRGLTIEGYQTSMSIHRLIMNAKKGQEVDHIDGDGLNNRRSNLRFCTKAQNQMNRAVSIGSSVYKGVYLSTKKDKWRACVRFNRKVTHLGYFATQKAAALAYDEKARELFGDFARPNFQEQP